MGRKPLEHQIRHALFSLTRFGESRHQAKKDLKAERGDDYRFGMSPPGIYSYDSLDSYLKSCLRFARWCIEEKGVHRYAKPGDIKHLVGPYLQHGLDRGLSIYTLKLDRSALGKLYGEPVNFLLPKRTPDKITRSRRPVEMDKHFSEEKNKDLATMALGTGGRRSDEASLCVDDYVKRNGHWYVRFLKSKGGRNRITPVLPGMEKGVVAIVNAARSEGRENLFDHIHTKMDVHSYRRQYAQKLYEIISKDHNLRDELLKVYPPRHEPKVKSKYYKPRRPELKGKAYLRDDLYLISQALGHNRLDVVVTHYLT